MDATVRKGADAFGLGRIEALSRVEGGLSNDMWRVRSSEGDFAVKVMRAHADALDFRGNVEAAFEIELRAFRAGVPCPEPRPTPEGRALLRVDGCWLRAHRWHDGTMPAVGEHLDAAGDLLARIHRAGHVSTLPLEDRPMGPRRWAGLAELPGLPDAVSAQLRTAAPALAQLESRTLSRHGEPTAFVDSHGDLDPKNTLVSDGRLLAVDWDAAGPRSVAREAVSLALDWSHDATGFRQALAASSASSGRAIPAEPWVLGGWVDGMSGWLAFNAEHRSRTALGAREVTDACTRLLTLHRSLDEHMTALGAI